jgi:putative metalloprotease
MSRACLIFVLILGIFSAGCEDTDIGMATQAGIEAVRAATLDDKEVQLMANQVSKQSDLKHSVAYPDHPYTRRLQRLTGSVDRFDGYDFDFKVYRSPKVNAFAMADGTIRIYSGLMDIMDDAELMFVIGHEMGHVIKKHVKKKIIIAYAGSAVRKIAASQQNEAGEIARSVLGALAQDLLSAQFSQQEEREADDFGVMLMKQEGYREQAAVSALMKLAATGNDHSFLSSHPAPEVRAERLRVKVSSPQSVEKTSRLRQFISWLKGLFPFGKDQQTHPDRMKSQCFRALNSSEVFS